MSKSPEELYNLRQQTGALLLLNCPKGMVFGIDSACWKTGDKFMGVNFVPYGAHFCYFSLSDEDHAAKQGFFVYLSPKNRNEIRKFEPESDFFEQLSAENTKNFSIGLDNLEFDKNLGPYPSDSKHLKLFSFISASTIDRIQPVNQKYITTSKEYEESGTSVKLNLYFSEFNLRQSGIGMTPNERTQANLDKSDTLKTLLSTLDSENEILGELQFAFITFFLGGVFEGFEQWKKLMTLLSFSETFLCNSPSFLRKYIQVLSYQIMQFPVDFFYDTLSQDNFIVDCLTQMKEFECTDSVATNNFAGLLAYLKKTFQVEILTEEEKMVQSYLNSN